MGVFYFLKKRGSQKENRRHQIRNVILMPQAEPPAWWESQDQTVT